MNPAISKPSDFGAEFGDGKGKKGKKGKKGRKGKGREGEGGPLFGHVFSDHQVWKFLRFLNFSGS